MTEEQGDIDPEQPAIDLDILAEDLGMPVEDVELTPEEELREAAARIRKVVTPRTNLMLAGLQQGNGVSRLLRDMDKWKRVGLADSLLKGALGNGAFIKSITAQSRIQPNILGKGVLASSFPTAKSLLPMWRFEQPWARQMKFINSDIYKMSGVGQGNLIAINSALARNANFGLGKTTPSWIGQFARQQNSWLKTLAPLTSFKFNIYPNNLRSIEGLRLEDVEEVVMIDGIALYGAPRAEIAEKLIDADCTAARREILGRRWKAISADCRSSLEGCTSNSVAEHVSFAVAALDALDGGNPRAAQALAASVLDTLVNGYFGKKRRLELTPNAKTKTPNEYDEFTARDFIAFAPLWQAYQQFHPDRGDRIPSVFNRHASVHGVSKRQFSRRNAVQALLFISGLLVRLDEKALKVEAA